MSRKFFDGPRAGVNRVPTRASAHPGYLSSAGGGESTAADLGVDFDGECGLV